MNRTFAPKALQIANRFRAIAGKRPLFKAAEKAADAGEPHQTW